MSKKHLEYSLVHMEAIGNFCVERETNDSSRALYYVSSIFDSTDTLFRLLNNQSDTLNFSVQGDSVAVDSDRQIKSLIIDQSRFTFVAIISILEFTAKNISLKEGLPVKAFLESNRGKKDEKDKKNKKERHYYLSNIMFASEKLELVTAEEKKEWDFFINIRNALVHNNAIPDEDLVCVVYGKLYSFKKGEEMKGDIQSLFIFSKRAVELFYDWSQKHEDKINP